MKRTLILLALILIPTLGSAAVGPIVGNTYQGSFHNRSFTMGMKISAGQNSYTWLIQDRWSLNFKGKTYHFPALTGTHVLDPTTKTLTFTVKMPATIPSLEDPLVGINIGGAQGFLFNFKADSKQLLGTFNPAGVPGTGFTLVVTTIVNGKKTNAFFFGNITTSCYNIVLKKQK